MALPTTVLLPLERKGASCSFLNRVSPLLQGKSTGLGMVNKKTTWHIEVRIRKGERAYNPATKPPSLLQVKWFPSSSFNKIEERFNRIVSYYVKRSDFCEITLRLWQITWKEFK